jgi:psiF repeat-containing protein
MVNPRWFPKRPNSGRSPSYEREPMKRYVMAVAFAALFVMPASAQLTSQQQRMKDCNTQASGLTGDARKQFMSSCLSGGGTTKAKKPHCVNGKPCGNSCIAKNEVCHH